MIQGTDPGHFTALRTNKQITCTCCSNADRPMFFHRQRHWPTGGQWKRVSRARPFLHKQGNEKAPPPFQTMVHERFRSMHRAIQDCNCHSGIAPSRDCMEATRRSLVCYLFCICWPISVHFPLYDLRSIIQRCWHPSNTRQKKISCVYVRERL